MRSTIINAPAKLNLYLDVINKRSDGYHNIETVFERIDLCDWIKVSVIPRGIKLICRDGIPKNCSNTAYKAAKLLIKNCNLNCGFKIEIDKRIPTAAGLGGGSSDAASTLLAINNLLNLSLKQGALKKLALEIGADTPFFVSGYKRAFAKGIGEKLFPLKQTPKLYFLLVVPNIEIHTVTIYNRLRIPLTNKASNANIFWHCRQHLTTNGIKNALFNRLEDVVLPSYPALANIQKALKKTGAEGILVSGSGSAVYGVFSSRKEAEKAEKALAMRDNWRLFLTTSY